MALESPRDARSGSVRAYGFRDVSPESRTDSVFKILAHDWMLVTAGTLESFNMLTASWGGFGILWEREVAMCVIRPGRHTFAFMEEHPMFTLSFFEERYRPALKVCGRKSGREINKMKDAGLTPVQGKYGGIYFEEARMVYECRKLYWHDLDPTHFVDPTLDIFYPRKDYHRLYVGEIKCVLARYTDPVVTPPAVRPVFLDPEEK